MRMALKPPFTCLRPREIDEVTDAKRAPTITFLVVCGWLAIGVMFALMVWAVATF